MRFAIACVALLGCNFSTKLTGDDAVVDAAIDAPPVSSSVKFLSITSTTLQLRPGLYGMEIVATLRNELASPITNLAVTLTFTDGTSNRAGDFRWRDFDAREGVVMLQPQTIGAGQEAVYRFSVDALPWAIPPGPIAINGAATFVDGAMPLSATPADAPLMLPFATFGSIVVSSAMDKIDADTQVTLREALLLAAVQEGLDRISFDPTVFPPSAPVISVLANGLGELVVNQDVVIDGHDAGVILAVNTSWENSGRYGLKISNGNVVVSGITFRNFGYGYQNEDLSGNNCGSGTFFDGGAIRVDNGQLVVDGNTFEDPDVSERNCFAASLRLEGGTRHRITNNTWTNGSMDAVYVDTSTLEISGNLINAGNNPSKVDECIFIASQGGQPLWITKNICVDQEFSGVVAGGNDAGALFVANNTFVRHAALSAIRRSGNRAITLRNNVFLGSMPSAIALDNNGNGFNIAYESVSGSSIFTGASTAATVTNVITPSDPGFVDSAGMTRASLSPTGNSPLISSGVDFIDVNGATPNHSNGAGVERGAIELP